MDPKLEISFLKSQVLHKTLHRFCKYTFKVKYVKIRTLELEGALKIMYPRTLYRGQKLSSDDYRALLFSMSFDRVSNPVCVNHMQNSVTYQTPVCLFVFCLLSGLFGFCLNRFYEDLR